MVDEHADLVRFHLPRRVGVGYAEKVRVLFLFDIKPTVPVFRSNDDRHAEMKWLDDFVGLRSHDCAGPNVLAA